MRISGNIILAWRKLKDYPVFYNIVRIAVVFAVVYILSFIGMAIATRHGMKRTVPDFTGLRLNDAEYYASRRGLEIIVNDSLYVPSYPGGIILDQLPNGGVDVKSGRAVYVTINSFHQKKVPLPYVAGRSLRQAKNMLEMSGLTIRELIYVDDIATNYVLNEYYDGREVFADSKIMVEKGKGVILYVGRADNAIVVIPELIGRTLHDAQSRLWEVGLNVGDVEYDEGITLVNRNDARVCSQSHPVGRNSQLGTRVSLHLTLDNAKIAQAKEESERQATQIMAEQSSADSLQQPIYEQRTVEQSEVQQQDENFFQ